MRVREEWPRNESPRRRAVGIQQHCSELNAALAGLGLAYLPEDIVKLYVAKRQLVRVLADWCATFSGYHLYYPSRRQHTPAFSLLVDAMRYRK